MKTTIYTIKALCITALLSVAPVLHSQENTLSREMTLEREYDPTVQDANKVNTLPSIKEPEVRKVPIDYATQTIPASPEKEFSLLPSGKVQADMAYNKRRGYLNLGAGTYLNINGDLGYHILRTDKDQLNIYFSHRSTNGNVKYIQTDEKVKAKVNDNLGGLNFSHVFDKAIFKLGGKYSYSAFNYYGLPMSYYGIPAESSVLPIASVPADTETNQVGQTIGVYTGIQSKEDAVVGYRLDIDYTNFSYKYGLSKDAEGPTEHTIDLKGGMSAAFNTDHRIGVDADIRVLNYSLPAEKLRPNGAGSYTTWFDNHTEIFLSPYYAIDGGTWHAKLGASVGYITGSDKFMASPNIALDAEVADKTVLYAVAKGEIRSNSLYDLNLINRYSDPTYGILPTRTWLDAIAGVRSGVAPGFWFDIFGGYKIASDDFFFVPNRTHGENDFGNYSSLLEGIDTKLLFFGAELRYAYQKFADFRLKGVYNSWKANYGDRWDGLSDSDVTPYGRPEMEITAGITLKPMKEVSVSADYYLATGRYTSINNDDDYKFKNINELNVTGAYTFNDTFGAYIKMNNVLFQKYEWYYGYPMQGFSVMAGINLNF